MEITTEVKELAEALAKAQGEIGAVQFDSTNPFYKSKYASLGAIIATAKPVLAKYGLSVIQPASSIWVDGTLIVSVQTVLMHSSGERISEAISMPINSAEKNLTQELGKVITYARRYSLAAMLGMYSDEDTDGSQSERPAEVAKPKAAVKQLATKSKRPYSPEELVKALQERAKTCSPASEAMEKLLVRKMQELIEDDDYRHLVDEFLFGSAHIAEADRTLITAGLKWLNLDDQYQVDPLAKQELDAVIKTVSGEDLNQSLL